VGHHGGAFSTSFSQIVDFKGKSFHVDKMFGTDIAVEVIR